MSFSPKLLPPPVCAQPFLRLVSQYVSPSCKAAISLFKFWTQLSCSAFSTFPKFFSTFCLHLPPLPSPPLSNCLILFLATAWYSSYFFSNPSSYSPLSSFPYSLLDISSVLLFSPPLPIFTLWRVTSNVSRTQDKEHWIHIICLCLSAFHITCTMLF